jgi:hypothetical protein
MRRLPDAHAATSGNCRTIGWLWQSPTAPNCSWRGRGCGAECAADVGHGLRCTECRDNYLHGVYRAMPCGTDTLPSMDKDERKALRERFFKERRMFLGVTVVLLAHQLLGITIASSADSFGLHFEVKNPERLFMAVWILWWWCLISYFQKIVTLGIKNFFPIDLLVEIYEIQCSRYVRTHVALRAKASFRRQVGRNFRLSCIVDTPILTVHESDGEKHRFLLTKVSTRWIDVPENPESVDVIDAKAAIGVCDGPSGTRWIVRHSGSLIHRDGTRGRDGSVEVPQAWIEQRGWLFYTSLILIYLFSSFAMDYLAPLFIGLIPGVIYLWHAIHG